MAGNNHTRHIRKSDLGFKKKSCNVIFVRGGGDLKIEAHLRKSQA